MAIKHTAGRWGLHQFNPIDGLGLKVGRPTDADRYGPTAFQSRLDTLDVTIGQPGGYVPGFDKRSLELWHNRFPGLQGSGIRDVRRTVAVVIRNLSLIHHPVFLIAEIERVKEPTIRILIDGQIARIV